MTTVVSEWPGQPKLNPALLCQALRATLLGPAVQLDVVLELRGATGVVAAYRRRLERDGAGDYVTRAEHAFWR
jgi:hypothetical protein